MGSLDLLTAIDTELAGGLSAGEREVVLRVARGHADKLVAHELGLAPSTVATRLTSACRKLGARSRAELVRLSRARGGDAAPADAKLTPAEREVALAIVSGATNAAIGAARGTSPRTVANLVARAFRKLGVRSRRELVARAGELGLA